MQSRSMFAEHCCLVVLIGRLLQAYESKINPFAEFQASEREERLPTHEKALLAGSKYVIALDLSPI